MIPNEYDNTIHPPEPTDAKQCVGLRVAFALITSVSVCFVAVLLLYIFHPGFFEWMETAKSTNLTFSPRL